MVSLPLWFTRTYYGLSSFERVVLLLRLFAQTAAVAFFLGVLVTPAISTKAYIARINCDNVDITKGLSQLLRANVAGGNEAIGVGLPVGASLTMSEVKLLSEYAQAQVALAPQYITLQLWRLCVGNYNISSHTDQRSGRVYYIRHNDVIQCTEKGLSTIDYRKLLEDIGLRVILAYAYNTPAFKDRIYRQLVKLQLSRFNMVPKTIIVALVFQFVVLVATILVYLRQPRSVYKFKPRWVVHMIGVLALGLMISSTVGIALVTNLVVDLQKEVSQNLGSFGISLQMGGLWFGLYWVAEAFCIVLVGLWCLPLWCSNPDDLDLEDDILLYTINLEHPPRRARMFSDFKVPVMLLFRHRTFSVYDHKESELRRLGRSLSKKSSVRRTKLGRKSDVDQTVTELRAPQYQDHYQAETYDGYQGKLAPNKLEDIGESVEMTYHHSQPRVLSNPLMQPQSPLPTNRWVHEDNLELESLLQSETEGPVYLGPPKFVITDTETGGLKD